MLLCSLYLQVILLLPNIYLRAELYTYNEEKSLQEPQKKSETLFSDVIKNISRVNNALQELINNYEKIQRFYETNSFEKDYSSDAEIDDAYKYKKHSKKTKSRTNIEDTNLSKNAFPATVMIVSDESESDTEDEEVNAQKVNKTIEDHMLAETKKFIVENVTDDGLLKEQLENLPTIKEIQESHSGPQIIILHPQRDLIEKDVVKKENLTASTTQEQKHKRQRIKLPKTFPIENNIETATPVPRPRIKQKPRKNVEKVIFAESFPQGKIWDDIAQKKPIRLRALRMPNIRLQKIHLRSRKTPQTALVIVTKSNKRKKEDVDVPTSLEHVFSSDSEDLNSKIIRANILRDAYGQACMRMVVKKCYKACKETKKLACKVTTCKNSFKEKFQEKSKTGCIMKFRPVPKGSDEKNGTKFLKKYSKTSDLEDSVDDDDFADITRAGGFPAETCYPFMIPQTRTKTQVLNSTVPNIDVHKQALRDRYERACARASSEKCNSACLYAYKESCETYACPKSRKKPFRKHCKRQCKKAYRSKDKKRSSRSSSSSSSETESDTSSTEFDTDDFE